MSAHFAARSCVLFHGTCFVMRRVSRHGTDPTPCIAAWLGTRSRFNTFSGGNPSLELARDVAGTLTGLSMVSYVRDTRRSIGINGFRLTYAALVDSSSDTSTPQSAPVPTGFRFNDTVAIGDYLYADTHKLDTCQYPAYMNEKAIKPYVHAMTACDAMLQWLPGLTSLRQVLHPLPRPDEFGCFESLGCWQDHGPDVSCKQVRMVVCLSAAQLLNPFMTLYHLVPPCVISAQPGSTPWNGLPALLQALPHICWFSFQTRPMRHRTVMSRLPTFYRPRCFPSCCKQQPRWAHSGGRSSRRTQNCHAKMSHTLSALQCSMFSSVSQRRGRQRCNLVEHALSQTPQKVGVSPSMVSGSCGVGPGCCACGGEPGGTVSLCCSPCSVLADRASKGRRRRTCRQLTLPQAYKTRFHW